MGNFNTLDLLPKDFFNKYVKIHIPKEKHIKLYYFTNTDSLISDFKKTLEEYIHKKEENSEKINKKEIFAKIHERLEKYMNDITKADDDKLMDFLIKTEYKPDKATKQNDDENKASFDIINNIHTDKYQRYETIRNQNTKNDIDRYLMNQGISTVSYLSHKLENIIKDSKYDEDSKTGGNYKKSKRNKKVRKVKKIIEIKKSKKIN